MPDGILRTPDDLIAAGLVPEAQRDAIMRVAKNYAIAIPQNLAALINDPHDPIGQQFIPHESELHTAPHEKADPVGDDAFSPLPGIVHRYPDRALLKPLLVCPVYCRFCFRREHVGPDGGLLTEPQLKAAIAYIAAHPRIKEVILTGGDPLLLSPRRLTKIFAALDKIPHLDLLRIHTRVPIADPNLVTEALAATLNPAKPLWLVVHANHATEFSHPALAALRRIQRQGIPILGQSVLLRGVNDSEQALEALFRTMLRARLKPYYLHQLDPAPGTARFHVPIEEGQRLLRALRGRIPGHALPTYILDIPGGHGKVPIGPTYLQPENRVRDNQGSTHALADPPPSR